METKAGHGLGKPTSKIVSFSLLEWHLITDCWISSISAYFGNQKTRMHDQILVIKHSISGNIVYVSLCVPDVWDFKDLTHVF